MLILAKSPVFGRCLGLALTLSGACSPATRTAQDCPHPQAPAAIAASSELKTDLPRPSLVLWITVDQMRGDYLARYGKHFGEGGFKQLLSAGAYFSNAHYAHAITETAPGHATLFTGASPAVHGIIGNSWILSTGAKTTSVTDPLESIVGPGAGSEVKPGRSPRLLLVPTLGDELIRQTRGASKVLAVSTKDRSAILPAGYTGRAIWMGERGFVTSSYYGTKAVPWLGDHHVSHPPERYLEGGWNLLLPAQRYLNPPTTSVHTPKSLGATFPHGPPADSNWMEALVNSPFGDSAVVDLAISALVNEHLGNDDHPDLLSVSLSSTDIIGHRFGPESLELEDQLIRLDRELDRLLRELKRLGLSEKTLVVLSADHGGCESAGYRSRQSHPSLRLLESEVEAQVRQTLKASFKDDRMFLGVESPYVYLSQSHLAQAGLDPVVVRTAVARALEQLPAVHSAYAKGALGADTELTQLISSAIHGERSGDVYIVPRPHSLFLQDEGMTATHGSPWNYDTHVPVILSRAGATARSVAERVDVRSLAPTVAALLGIPAPAGASAPLLPSFGTRDGRPRVEFDAPID